jgi:demethoxyubiquinone hydroxylase (CLK1/Coq7/Cat5 family)
MSNYKPYTSVSQNGVWTQVIRVDSDGTANTVQAYAGRYFQTKKAAIRSCEKWIAKYC